MKDLIIIGAGTYGEVICELAESVGYNVLGFYDDDPSFLGKMIMGKSVMGAISNLNINETQGKNFAVAIGNNKTRAKMMEKILSMEGYLPSLVHPKANVCSSATIGKGVYIHAGAYIWTKAQIGDFTIISPNTVIAHHTKIGKACLISTLCAIGAQIDIEEYTMLGLGTSVITGVKRIGHDVLSSGGTVIIKDVEDKAVVVGNPARKIRENI